MVLGILAVTLYLVLAIVCDLGVYAWWAVIGIALLATIYTALGGLKAVVFTDAIQTVIMLISSVALFWLCWHSIGGWNNLKSTFETHEPGLAYEMLHVGSDTIDRTPIDGKTHDEVDQLLLLGGVPDNDQ